MDERAENTGNDRLSVAERIILVQDIWDSIAADQGHLAISESQKADLDMRMNEHLASPTEGSSWDQAVRRIRLR